MSDQPLTRYDCSEFGNGMIADPEGAYYHADDVVKLVEIIRDLWLWQAEEVNELMPDELSKRVKNALSANGIDAMAMLKHKRRKS